MWLNWTYNIKNPWGHWFSSALIILSFRKPGNMTSDVSEVPVHFKAHAQLQLLCCFVLTSEAWGRWPGRKASLSTHPPPSVFSLEALTGQSLPELRRWSHVNRALAVAVDQGGIGAVAQQEGADLHTVLGSSLVQRGELPEVHSIHAGTMLAQQKKPWIRKKSFSTTKKLTNFYFIIKIGSNHSCMNTHTQN